MGGIGDRVTVEDTPLGSLDRPGLEYVLVVCWFRKSLDGLKGDEPVTPLVEAEATPTDALVVET